jgi:hypothetical protein
MAEEEVGLAPENVAPTTPESETQSEGVEQSTQAEVDPKFAGKSIDDLKEMVRNQEKLLGKQANEVGEVRALRQEMDYLRDQLVQSMRQPERQPAQTQDKLPEFDLTNPDPYFESRMKRFEANLRQEFGQREQQRLRQEVAVKWDRGKNSFFTEQNRHLYDGIEKEVEAQVANYVRSNPNAIYNVDDPTTWRVAAQAVRLVRGEADRLVKKPAMRAQEVEKPGTRAQGGNELTLDDEMRLYARSRGWTEKEALENLKAGVDGVNSGLTYKRGI